MRETASHSDARRRPERIVLIGCVATKLDRPAPAAELYCSPLFVKRRAYAEATGYRWFILSALHGVVEPALTLWPYNSRLTKPGIPSWATEVRRGLRRIGLAGGDLLEVHAGADYTDGVERACRWLARFEEPPLCLRIEAPLRGLALGRQLQWYGQAAST
jgi:hypothetical protein